MDITKEEKNKLTDFFRACNDMIEGRFILSDTKVANILKCIVNSDILYNMYSKCVSNFKFAIVLENSLASNPGNEGHFVMPDDNKQIVAFVTCLLLEVDKKNISLQSFVTDNFFNPDGYNISYNSFAVTVLDGYKTAVKNLLGIDENGNVVKQESIFDEIVESDEDKNEADEETKILFANLLMNINELQNSINDDYKIKYSEKEELIIVLKALTRAVKIEELLIINALLVPLERSLNKNKKYKSLYGNIKMLIADIYY